MDTTASDVLEELDEALNARGISLVFAELKDPVRRKIERYGLTRGYRKQSRTDARLFWLAAASPASPWRSA